MTLIYLQQGTLSCRQRLAKDIRYDQMKIRRTKLPKHALTLLTSVSIIPLKHISQYIFSETPFLIIFKNVLEPRSSIRCNLITTISIRLLASVNPLNRLHHCDYPNLTSVVTWISLWYFNGRETRSRREPLLYIFNIFHILHKCYKNEVDVWLQSINKCTKIMSSLLLEFICVCIVKLYLSSQCSWTLKIKPHNQYICACTGTICYSPA